MNNTYSTQYVIQPRFAKATVKKIGRMLLILMFVSVNVIEIKDRNIQFGRKKSLFFIFYFQKQKKNNKKSSLDYSDDINICVLLTQQINISFFDIMVIVNIVTYVFLLWTSMLGLSRGFSNIFFGEYLELQGHTI